ncbi:MAG: ATPase, T2SS/T4P/T4SS family [Methylococcales bacterium]|nr:ATPase, T2SS/T4P/T4SS family [Methylococcales bacterium]
MNFYQPQYDRLSEHHLTIGQVLLNEQVITPTQLEYALQKQRVTGEKLGETLLRLGIVPESDVARCLASLMKLNYCPLESVTAPDKTILELFNHELCSSLSFLPLKRVNNTLQIVIGNADPEKIRQVVRRRCGLNADINQGEFSQISRLINHYYQYEDDHVYRMLTKEIERLNQDHDQVFGTDNLLDYMLHLAIKERATDIHIQPEQKSIHLSLRIDGVLQPFHAFPVRLKRLVSAIKVKANMDISDNLHPQDGRFRQVIDETDYDLRVSTVITPYGENMVIRLLPGNNSQIKGLSELGFLSRDLSLLSQLFHQPHGIVLLTGPTGSGKTTTMYAGLRAQGLSGKNIITIEDPVEYELPGIVQTQVNRRSGYVFDTAVAHFLRHDPDVMLIGEIRDNETAKVAIQSAETGHLVLSTLHVNSVFSVISRLNALGVSNSLLANALIGVVNQRLARRICESCKAVYQPTHDDCQWLGESPEIPTVYHGQGCKECRGTGYHGRLPIYEILLINRSIADMITLGKLQSEIKDVAASGHYISMIQLAKERIFRGETSIAEVKRIFGDSLDWKS